MKPGFFNRESVRTAFIQLDTRKCKACWKCIDNCRNSVIGKVDLPWHKHALIIDPGNCTGCLKCIKTCEYEAYSKNDTAGQETNKQMRRILNRFLINNLLLIFGMMTIFSGLALQLGFHMGGEEGRHGGGHGLRSQSITYEQVREIDPNKIVLGFNYSDWSTIHRISIVTLTLFMIYHIYSHWKWYKGIISKHLIGKNVQVVTLSALFLLTAVTGLVPWFIDLSGSTSILRLIFIEIHDKLTFILIIYLVLHVVKRNGWYQTTYSKLNR